VYPSDRQERSKNHQPSIPGVQMSTSEQTDEIGSAGTAVGVGPLGPASDQQHRADKLTARQRIDALLDDGSFVELDGAVRHRAFGFGMEDRRPAADAVVTGWGTIDGRRACVFADDASVFGGSQGEAVGEKVSKVMDLAMATGAPIVGLRDSGGARIQEGVVALDACGQIFARNVRASGVIPQVSVIMGACAGAAVYSPALTDFIYQVNGGSHLFITGPEVIRAVNGEDVTFDSLGGARSHASISGVTHFVAGGELEALEEVRYLLSFLPQNNLDPAPTLLSADGPDRMESALDGIVPESPNQPYDMTQLIGMVVDDGELYQVHEHYARNIIVGFARLSGRTIGVVGNNPAVLAGTLDIDASVKAARFVRFCDSFNIPVVAFVDVPGFLPGLDQEQGGIIRHGAKLLYAFCEATVPRLTVITRKAYGGAYIVMNSRSVGADLVFAWPTAEIAVMGAEAAVNIIHRRRLAGGDEQHRAELVEDYTRRFNNPHAAAERGLVDQVIEPRQTRPLLIKALAMLGTKRTDPPRRKHGNIPL
jgi:propionyl-CoA carboxylase beta chain